MRLGYFAQKCEKIEATSSQNLMRDIVVNVMRDSDAADAEIFVRFLLGERYDDPELSTHVGPSTIAEAAARASSVSKDAIDLKIDEEGSIEEGIEAAYEASGFTGGSSAMGDDVLLEDVYDTVQKLPDAGGNEQRIRLLQGLFVNCETPEQAKWVAYCIVKDMRIGVGSGTVKAAIVELFGVRRSEVDRGYALLGSAPKLVRRLKQGRGIPTAPEPGTPFNPMLASSDDVEMTDRWIAQPKFDGARVVIHCDGENIRIFTRNQKEVTDSLPEVVEALSTDYEYIVDGEVVGYNPDGEVLPFNATMKRLRREQNIEKMRQEITMRVFLFDILLWEGDELSDKDLTVRSEILHEEVIHAICEGAVFPDRAWEGVSVPVTGNGIVQVCPEGTDAEAMYERALELGHEGIIVKDPRSPYVYGERESTWRKGKPSETVDVRVTGFNYGTGENANRLGSLDIESGDGKDLGSVGIGFTDDFRDNIGPDDIVGEIIEVESEELQEDGLRFPAFIRVRQDKDEADTTERIRNALN